MDACRNSDFQTDSIRLSLFENPLQCKMSCKVCQTPVTTSSTSVSTTTKTPENCIDDNVECSSWAAAGECQANPNYMLVQCKKSCQVCQEASTTASTSSTKPSTNEQTSSTMSTISSLHPTLPPKTTSTTIDLSTATGMKSHFILFIFHIFIFLYLN